MPDHVADDAICLRVLDFSETSQIVSLFTAHHGVLGVIAKGSKRQTKKGGPGGRGGGGISGPLDLLTAGQLVFIPARGAAELATLTAWNLTNHRSPLRTSLAALNAAMLATEVTLGLLHPHDPHDDLFPDFDETLNMLAAPERPRVLVSYLKAALTATGYQPHLEACLNCARALTPDEPARFSPAAGGVICHDCSATAAAGPSSSIGVPGRIIIALQRLPTPRQLAANPPDRPADPAALRTACQLLLAEVESITDRPIRTRALLDSIFT